MKRLIVGVAVAMATMVAGGASVGAQIVDDDGYTEDDQLTVSAAANPCTPASAGSPQNTYEVTSNGTPSAIELQFYNGAQPVGGRISVASLLGTVGHPGNPADFGWTKGPDYWERNPASPTLSVQVFAVIGGNNVQSAVASVTYQNGVQCVGSGANPPPPPAAGGTPPVAAPAPPAAIGSGNPLPRTGIGTVDTLTRLGALLLIAGLAAVIVTKRRRFSITAPQSPTSTTI